MMHASIQCGIVPSNVTGYSKKQTHCFHASARAINSSHITLQRIVSIMANTSLVSETLLTKHSTVVLCI